MVAPILKHEKGSSNCLHLVLRHRQGGILAEWNRMKLAALAPQFFSACLCRARPYFVSLAGDDANPGTLGKPLKGDCCPVDSVKIYFTHENVIHTKHHDHKNVDGSFFHAPGFGPRASACGPRRRRGAD
jgi:hypothetical protein